jgi:3-phenylpropionate/cinnamic acid dioxygenase small subunit
MAAPGADPDSQLRRLADREEIAELLFEYCYSCDRNDAEGVAACFTEDCVAEYGTGPEFPSVGAAARGEQAARDLALFEATSHLLSNVSIEFEGADRARTRSVVQAWHRPRDGGSGWMLHAQYHDVVTRTEAGWQIAERRLVVVDADPFPTGWDFHRLERLG